MKFFTGLTFTLLAITACFSQSERNYQFPKGTRAANYYPNIIIVRVKESSTESARVNLKTINEITKEEGISNFKPLINRNPAANTRQKNHPLANIYKLEIGSDQDLMQNINDLLNYEEIITITYACCFVFRGM